MPSPAKNRSESDGRPDEVLGEFRAQARQLLARQRSRVEQVQATLARRLDELRGELERQQDLIAGHDTELEDAGKQLGDLRRQRDQAVEARREAEMLLDEARVAISQAAGDQHELRLQLSQCKKQLNSRADELKELRARLLEATGSGEQLHDELASQLTELRDERDRCHKRIQQLEQQLETAADSPGDSQQLTELSRRFEMAVQEVRDLKARNAELTEQLANARRNRAPDAATTAGFSWEEHKRRLMEQLESEFDDADPVQRRERLTVEGAIRITDQVVAEKDEEIAELKQLLNDQSSNIGNMAVGAAAIAGILDQDELIRQERESLHRLQEEWRDKLRRAEIDVSVERAKLARERVELQEKLQTFAAERAAFAESAGDAGDQKPRGRWLKRLGLKEMDE